MSALDLRTIARRLGGEVHGRAVLAPGPSHSPGDRSLSVRLSWQSPGGFVCFSHSGDSFQVCRDYVCGRLGIDTKGWKSREQVRPAPIINVDNIHVDKPDQAARIGRAIAIWNEAGDAHGTVVESYLVGRGLNLPDGSDVLRYHPRCPWGDKVLDRTIFVPAMVAAMRQTDGDAITGIHRTRLTPEGVKVDRKMLGQTSGSAIKIDPDDAVTMGLAIGEGIETVLAARTLGFQPAWAVASAGAIAGFQVLGGVECLTLLAENDPTNARAVDTCARRWHAAGREVIVIEPRIGSDMNDALRGAV